MRPRLLCCLPLVLLPACSTGRAMDPGAPSPGQIREALFLQVFKQPAPKLPVSGYVLVAIDGTSRQKVPALLSPVDGQVHLESRPILARLQPLLQPDLLHRLERMVDGQGRLGAAALQEAGLTVSFDPRRFELKIDTPPEMRGTMVSHLSPPPPDPFRLEAVRPAALSGFLNFNLKGTAHSGPAGGGRRPTAAALALDGALNLRGLVVEGSAYGQTGRPGTWQRGDLRLVYDKPEQALRFMAGDLSYPVVGYQTLTGLLGLGIARDFSLQPHLPTWRTNEFEFYLARPAEVQVWVNESLVSTLHLPAGAHDIRGLNAAVGQNDVRLVIEDGAGRRDALEFSFLFNPVLLERNRHVFSWNAGFRREPGGNGYRYDLGHPMVSGSFLRGWTDRLTLGAYTQLDDERVLFGLRTLRSLSAGTLQMDAAVNRLDPGPWDAGIRLELTGNPPRKGGLQTQLALEYLGRHFGTSRVPASSATVGVRASVAAPLGRNTTGRLNGSYIPARRSGQADACLVSATLSRRWGRYVNGSVALRHRRTALEPATTEALFGLSVSFTRNRASFHAAKELETDTVAMRWDSGRSQNSSQPYGFAELRAAENSREYRGGAGYSGYRGLAEIAHRRIETDTASGRQNQEETTLRLQGALVYADGVFALARPVAENFAIVAGRHGLSGVALRIDPDDRGGSRARSDRLGPAVVEDLASYRLRDLRVEPVNPPLGATPDKTVFTLSPAYKSGVLLRLGREPQIVAIGRLVGDGREPLAHLAIEIRRLDRPGEPPVSTFTNRNGVFQLPDLRPGRYEIRPTTGSRGSVTVEIPATPDSLHRLGEIRLPRT